MTVAVIVVSYNTQTYLRACLRSIETVRGGTATEIICVDNAPSDGSPAMVSQEFPSVRLIAQAENLGFGRANNAGIAAAAADTVVLLNSDAVLREDTPGALARYLADHPDVACAAPRIVLPDGVTPQPRVYGNQPGLWRLAMQAVALHALLPLRALEGVDGFSRTDTEAEVGWVSGVCMAMRRADVLAVGGFDPGIFMYGEDTELCARLAARGRIVRVDRWPVPHHGGASSPAMAARLRNAVWAQRNQIAQVRGRSGAAAGGAARALVGLGMGLRVAAGLVTIPSRGIRGNALLRTSWARLLDLASP